MVQGDGRTTLGGSHRRCIAVLIDAENAPARIADQVFSAISAFGEPAVRRAYGDFTAPSLRPWVETMARNAITPHQNFAAVPGKNSADLALAIDAMDLLLSNRFDAFCIISSDSDFVRLATRIREQGIPVVGFGERTAPSTWQAACTRFVIWSDLPRSMPDLGASHSSPEPHRTAATAGVPRQLKPMSSAEKLIRNVLRDTASADGSWVRLSALGARIRERHPDFSAQSYGHAQLSGLLRASGAFELRGAGSGLETRRRSTS